MSEEQQHNNNMNQEPPINYPYLTGRLISTIKKLPDEMMKAGFIKCRADLIMIDSIIEHEIEEARAAERVFENAGF